MDYVYKKSGAVFNAHSYWTKQPIDAVAHFIEQNTSEGDVVLDPFCGTGMTGAAAIKTNRNFVISDISKVCLHISKGYCTKYNKEGLNKKIDILLEGLDGLYTTKCPICGSDAQTNFLIVRDELEQTRRLAIEKVCYKCSCSKNKLYKEADSQDISKFCSEEYKRFFYPKDYFFGQEPKRNYRKGIYQVYQLYSGRNITALSILWDRIQSLTDYNFRTLCEFAFTAILFNCSLLSRYSERYENTKIRMGTYYIPYLIKDNNVVKSFRAKLNAIIKANDNIFLDDYSGSGIIQFDDATKLDNVEDDSIDYIYTDPPYSDKISYAELNLVYESWLGEKTDSRLEMIVSKAEDKTIDDFGRMFGEFLENAYRVLKDGKRITVIFHNANVYHWKVFQHALAKSKFIPIATELPERLISNSKTASQHSTKKKSQCFLAFTMEKKYGEEKSALKRYEKDEYLSVIKSVEQEALSQGYTSGADIFDYIINKAMFSFELLDNVAL